MNDRQRQAIREMLERRTRENTGTPELARAWILRDGVHRKDGALKTKFGGEPRDKEAAKA